MVEWCIDQAKGRVPVIAGAGSNSTAEAIELSQHAEQAGADAVLIVTPYYNKPTQEGLYQHYKAINDAIGIPIIIYNIPGRSIVDMSVDTMTRLYEMQEHRRRQGRHRQHGAGVAAARRHGRGFQPDVGRGHHRARLHGAWRPWLHLGDLERGAAAVRGVPERVPQGRFRRRAQAAGQAGAAAHRSVRRDQPGADQIRHVADRQMRQYRAAADGAGEREGASRRARRPWCMPA